MQIFRDNEDWLVLPGVCFDNVCRMLSHARPPCCHSRGEARIGQVTARAAAYVRSVILFRNVVATSYQETLNAMLLKHDRAIISVVRTTD